MATISKKAIYALKALMVLALNQPRWPLALREIAEGGHIPLKFLEQIMMGLRSADLVASQKGPRGGYGLAHAAPEIAVSSVLAAVEGQRFSSQLSGGVDGGVSGDSRAAAIERVLREAADSAARVFGAKSLADLCEDSRAILAEQRAVMYHI